jgi:hypothetical protein
MTRRIWKYQLEATDYQQITMPARSKVLSATVQREAIVVYAIVDDEEELKVPVSFWVFGTGHSIDKGDVAIDQTCYIGTVSLYNGGLMFHVFYDPWNLMIVEEKS